MASPSPAALVVNGRRGFWALRGMAAVGIAAACAWGFHVGSGLGAALGAVGAAMFAGFAAYALRQLARRGPRLKLDAAGVDAADLGVGTIPWASIAEVEGAGSPEAPFVVFHVLAPEAFAARMPAWPRTIFRLLRAQGMPPFSINLIGVDTDPWTVVERARMFLDASRPG